eukprot:TRINITY_DN1981_c0_g1_i1.p1 TRINITY_DN1981_c0_g1~~TRINITY_DN1981_c0_g1_i1.p1  ORF type:complete len:260 (+),score=60.49 TRINITY_DN1981_c0_g1_i1:755-1534(+)
MPEELRNLSPTNTMRTLSQRYRRASGLRSVHGAIPSLEEGESSFSEDLECVNESNETSPATGPITMENKKESPKGTRQVPSLVLSKVDDVQHVSNSIEEMDLSENDSTTQLLSKTITLEQELASTRNERDKLRKEVEELQGSIFVMAEQLAAQDLAASSKPLMCDKCVETNPNPTLPTTCNQCINKDRHIQQLSDVIKRLYGKQKAMLEEMSPFVDLGIGPSSLASTSTLPIRISPSKTPNKRIKRKTIAKKAARAFNQ